MIRRWAVRRGTLRRIGTDVRPGTRECTRQLKRETLTLATDRAVFGESDEDQRTMENHATRPESCPRSRGGRAIVRHSNTVRSDLTEFVVP